MTLFVGAHVHGKVTSAIVSTTTPSVSMTRTVRRGFTSLCFVDSPRPNRKADVRVPPPMERRRVPYQGHRQNPCTGSSPSACMISTDPRINRHHVRTLRANGLIRSTNKRAMSAVMAFMVSPFASS